MTEPTRRPDEEKLVLSKSPEETFSLGAQLGELVQPGDFIGLTGELGTGKTQLARGLAEGAGVPRGQVASPSFAIVYPYQGRLPVYHADFYRLANYDELYATGFTDLLAGEGVVVVEWLDRIPGITPPELLWIEMQFAEREMRRIHARAFGSRYRDLLRHWASSQVS